MKKLIPFLIIGVLLLSSFGAVATVNNQTESEPAKIDKIEVQCHALTVVIRVEVGSSPQSSGTFELTIDAPIMLFGRNHIIKLPKLLPAHQPWECPFGLSFGFGRCNVRVTFDVDNDGDVDTEASQNGFIFGPLIIFRDFNVPKP
jgi:CHASE1-domain containing sensor protein